VAPALTPLLPQEALGLLAYRELGGYDALLASREDPATLLATLTATTLTGLGGAHFPFAAKLSAALATPGSRVVVCNAAEDEPGSRKDAALLELNPHAVIEGALLAAEAIDAGHIYFYVRESFAQGRASLTQALDDLASHASLASDRVVTVHLAPTAYVAGEASAAIRSLEGEDAKPHVHPPEPTESGFEGRPTLVSNCETLANLPRVARAGSDSSDGLTLSRLATVTGDVLSPGVYEVVPASTTFADLLAMAGGLADPGSELKAIQPGGPSSAYLPASAADTLLTNEAIRAAGSAPGCLAVRVLSQSRCLVAEVSAVTSFFAREQCGQCPSCRMKTQNYSALMTKISHGSGSWKMLDQFATVDEFVADMPRRCTLIDMPTPSVRSAIAHFREDFTAHIDGPGCAGCLSSRSDNNPKE